MERIRELLALTESPDVDKAATAAAKAQDLLDIYNLEKYQADAHGESGSEYDGIAVTSSRHIFHYHKHKSMGMWTGIEYCNRPEGDSIRAMGRINERAERTLFLPVIR